MTIEREPVCMKPAVYVDEAHPGPPPIRGADMAFAGFAGPAASGPLKAVLEVRSFEEYERAFGGGDTLAVAGAAPVPNYLRHAARGFFENGGARLYVARARKPIPRSRSTSGPGAWPPDAAAFSAALARLAAVPEIGLVAAPGSSALPDAAAIARAITKHVADHSGRFALLDPPPNATPAAVRAWRAGLDSRDAALFYPWVLAGPSKLPLPPSGHVAGLLARGDRESSPARVPKSPVIKGIAGLERALTGAAAATLSAENVNPIRALPGSVIRVWGWRTLSTDPEWKYVNVSRYLAYAQRSIDQGTQWVAFEPNGPALWANVRRAVEDFLTTEWRTGALQGNKPDEAFFVRCDRTTMTQADLDSGRLICHIGVAPVKPAEFVIIRIGRYTSSD